MSNKNVTLPQLQKSVFNMKNYVDNSLPDAERFINERIVEVNCDTANPEIHKTYSSGAEQYIYNFDITGKHSNDMGIAVEVIMNNTNYNYITKNNYIMKNYETQTKYNRLSSIIYIVDNSTNKEIGSLSLYLGCSMSLDESDSVIKTPNLHDSACIELSRRVTQISDDTNNLFINGFKVKIKFYDISTKYAGDLYDIPYYLLNGEKSGSLQSYKSTVNGVFSQSIGYLNTVNGDYSTAIGQLNKIDTYNSMAYGYKNNLTGGHVIAIGTNNNIGNFDSIALGRDLTIEGLNRETAGNMILGKGGTLANDSLFAISTSLNNPNNGGETLFDTVRYPFEVKKDNTVYLRASNLILETDNVPSEDKHLITKKYVDDKVASLVDSAPETLDTLKELSTALGDDPNFATTMTTALGNKVDKVDGKTLSTNDLTNELKANYDAAYTHSQSAHFDGDYNSLSNIPTDLVKTSDADSKYAPIDSPNFINAISMGRISNSTVGTNSVALGVDVEASGNYGSHAEGKLTISSGIASHAEGSQTTASGMHSHSEGFNTIASGNVSHAEGVGTIAKGSGSHTQGKYNIEDINKKYAHILGNGTSDTQRSNAHTIDWSGNAWYQGSVYTGGTGQDDTNAKKLATEEFVNNNKVTKTSELTNDSGFITSIPVEYVTETELTAKNYIDNTTLENKGYLTEHQDLSSYALKTDLHTHANKAILDAITDAKITEWNSKSTFSGNYNDLTNKPIIPEAYTHPSTHPASMITGLATIATSGSYNDLTNKPIIPTVSNDLTNALKANYDAAYTHSQSAHAPSNAQKNSDITKSEIEAKLTGDVTTHTHSQYLTSIPSEYITEQELTSKGYITEAVLTSKGYATESQINSAVEAAATTNEEVKTTVNQILGGAYIE